MDEKMIPYFSHEGDMARMERTNRRLFVIVIILIVALLGTNAGWLIYESQFETVQTQTTKVEQEAEWEDGSNIIMNGTGEVNVNGQSEADDNDDKNKEESQENRRQ